MDNTTIKITNVNDPISIPAGKFRIYGNKVANLAVANYEKTPTVLLYPNPASSYFTLNAATSKVPIFSITVQLVKTFDANQSEGYQFIINDLNQGLFIVKAYDENNEVEVMKFIKE